MGFLDNVTGLVGVARALHKVAKEIEALRLVQQEWVDSFREASGLPIHYGTQAPEPEPAPREFTSQIIADDDHQSWHVIEALAKEDKIDLAASADWAKTALDQGWVDQNGEFLRHPQHPVEMEKWERWI